MMTENWLSKETGLLTACLFNFFFLSDGQPPIDILIPWNDLHVVSLSGLSEI